jgi:uncharacterized protein (TIGR02996 family)
MRVSDPVEQQLLDAIAANPADPHARSVYADWLESVGGAAHAEFLRTQLALAGVDDAADPTFQTASVRLRELAARLEPAWRECVAMAFVEACPPEIARRSMWALTVAQRGGAPRRIVFDVREATLGSAPRNDVVLAGDDVSRLHARIVLKDGKLIVVDLRSDSGTSVNGRKLAAPLVVKATDEIAIGEFVLRAELASATDRPTAPRTEAGRLAMELVCPQRWDRLAPTGADGVRHCSACRRDVHYCTTIDQARAAAQRGGCVAVDLQVRRRQNDLEAPPPPPPMMGAPLPVWHAPPPPPQRSEDFDDEVPTVPAVPVS